MAPGWKGAEVSSAVKRAGPRVALLVLAGTVVAAAPAGPPRAVADAPAPAVPPAAGAPSPSAEELKSRLLAEAAGGKVTDSLVSLFEDYAQALARGKWVPSAVSEESWQWLSSRREIRDALLIGLYPSFEPKVAESLAALRAKFPRDVEAFPHLATAFAMVYGHAGASSVRDPLAQRLQKGRPVPSMEDSFSYYVKNEKAMKMSLKSLPWPILVYVADNDLPMDDRQWALQQYDALAPPAFARVYYDVSYNNDLVGVPTRAEWTLPAIRAKGGTCWDRAFYASRILKSLGVPSMIDRGDGERGDHAWLAWVGREGTAVDLMFSGRFDYDRYYTGAVYNPITRRTMLDREVQLDVAALLRSYKGYLDALAACYVYALCEPEERAHLTGLLDGAIQRNPYCHAPWRLMAKGCADGVLSARQGEVLYELMLRSLATYPDLTFEVLEGILAPRLKPQTKSSEAQVARNLQVLENAFMLYEGSKRPDLAVKLKCLQGRYLEAAGRREDALKLYVLASERYVAEHYGFVALFDRAVRIMRQGGRQDVMLKYMGIVADKVPEYASDFNRRHRLVNPTFVHVVKAYATALRAAGETAEADYQQSRLPSRREG